MAFLFAQASVVVKQNVSEMFKKRLQYYRHLAAAIVPVILGLLFWQATLLPRMPNNPLTISTHYRGVIAEIMSFDNPWRGVSEFLRTNNLKGNVFSNVVISGFLLFDNPDLKFFMDLRAQSFFNETLMNDYINILASAPEGKNTSDLLESYGTELVILDTSSDFTNPGGANDLIISLLKSGKWSCIYKDRWVFVLVYKKASFIEDASDMKFVQDLKFSSANHGVLARAYNEMFGVGNLSEETLIATKRAIQNNPDPEMYRFIAQTYSADSACMTKEETDFFVNEVRNLSKMDFTRIRGGAPIILKSLWTILDILRKNAIACGKPDQFQLMTEKMGRVRSGYEDLRRRYDGV
jgi:hypothetical protein